MTGGEVELAPDYGPEVSADIEGETDRQYLGRRTYLELGGTRSLLSAYNEVRRAEGLQPVGSAPGAWRRWASRWDWANSAAVYDAKIAESAMTALAGTVTEARMKVAGTAMVALDKLRSRIESLDPQTIPVGSVSGLFRESVSALFRAVGFDHRSKNRGGRHRSKRQRQPGFTARMDDGTA